jgi:hypothetical protein
VAGNVFLAMQTVFEADEYKPCVKILATKKCDNGIS